MVMEESTTTPPDDVVSEILLRLDDVATLFRCAVTCKSWRRLVANPHFLLRRQWPRSPVVGFFTKRCPGTETSPTDPSSQLVFVPLPGPSLLGTRPRALSSFVIHAAGDAAVVDRASPLATRGGLLVVRLYSSDGELNRTTFSMASVFNPIVRLAVCNPLAGTWDVLPELNCQSRLLPANRYGCCIVPSIAGDGSSPAFKVLMVGEDKRKPQFNLHMFASGEASWRAPTKCFDMTERHIMSIVNTEAVVCRGYAHWLFVSGESNHFHVLNVDLETGHASLTKLLGPTRDEFWRVNLDDDYDAAMAHNQRVRHDLLDADRLVTTSNGTRLSLCTYRGRRLEIWTQHQGDGHQNGDGDAEWRHTAGETDHKLTALIQQLEQPSCVWSGERSGTMLIAECPGERVYIARLATGTLEEATDQFPDHPRNGTTMPMEIDWPTYFMLRLGGSW